MRAVNPDVVYSFASGFGETGPRGAAADERPAHAGAVGYRSGAGRRRAAADVPRVGRGRRDQRLAVGVRRARRPLRAPPARWRAVGAQQPPRCRAHVEVGRVPRRRHHHERSGARRRAARVRRRVPAVPGRRRRRGSRSRCPTPRAGNGCARVDRPRRAPDVAAAAPDRGRRAAARGAAARAGVRDQGSGGVGRGPADVPTYRSSPWPTSTAPVSSAASSTTRSTASSAASSRSTTASEGGSSSPRSRSASDRRRGSRHPRRSPAWASTPTRCSSRSASTPNARAALAASGAIPARRA